MKKRRTEGARKWGRGRESEGSGGGGEVGREGLREGGIEGVAGGM